MGTKNLQSLYDAVFKAEKIGRNGLPILCILGKPYKIPGQHPLA
jgi:hypothetical protein